MSCPSAGGSWVKLCYLGHSYWPHLFRGTGWKDQFGEVHWQSLFVFLKRSQFWNVFGPGAIERIGAITVGSDTHFRPLLVVWPS